MDLKEFSKLNTSTKNELYHKPFIINTTLNDWSVPSFWNLENLLLNYGAHIFEMGTSEQLVISGGKSIMNDTLNNYMNDKIRNGDIYIFDRTVWNKMLMDNINNFNSSLFNFSLWKRDKNNINNNYNIIENGFIFIFSINSNNKQSGTAFHRHDTVWSAVLKGRKKWFLYPPYITPIGGYLPGYSTYHWFKYLYKYLNKTINIDSDIIDIGNQKINKRFLYKSKITSIHDIMDISNDWNDYKPIECIVNEGQILYLPKLYWHSVLNLDDLVIGITVQDNDQMTSEWPSDKQRKTMSSNYYSVGFEQFQMNNIQNAIKYFEKCISLDPTFIHCYLLLGRIYWFKLHEINTAERMLRMAYILNPYSISVQNGLVGLFTETQKWSLIPLVQNNQPLPLLATNL